MRVTLLGTGGSAGVPMIGGANGFGEWGACDPAEARNIRTRASIAVQAGQGTLLVDTSPDLRSQLISNGIKDIEAVLFTHAHADHIMGLDDLRLVNRVIGRPLDAYATQQTLEEVLQRFGYAFRPWAPPNFFRPVLVAQPVLPDQTIEVAGMSVRLFDQDHRFVHTLGLRIGGFGYSTDAVALDDAAFAALEGVDTWVVGCFQRTPHQTHAWLDLVLEWIVRLSPRRAVLTHMGVDMDWAWVSERLPKGVEVGYDGQVLEIASG